MTEPRSSEQREASTTGARVRAPGGEPTPDEMAAIVAAYEALWPKPVAASAPEPPPRWRFSGRWWTKPVPLSRNRP